MAVVAITITIEAISTFFMLKLGYLGIKKLVIGGIFKSNAHLFYTRFMVRLERLKLKNFKSFKNSIIPISEGYTTVIGPNGSGKSNFLDSIYFALGSSSMKNMRVSKLMDLVHPDSDTAEVSLEMRDGDELHAISRTIDKNGNSIFRLNKKRTTKFHIEELLNKLHVRADGHNIIMQGDITRVIKMTPMQRRGVIDEVSGIAEYEDKKQDSLRELSKVEAKLNEASIIMSERKGYLAVLEKERQEAQDYTNVKQDVKAHKASIIKKELESAEKGYDKELEGISQLRLEVEKIIRNKDNILGDISGLEKQYDELNKRIMQESDKRQMEARKEIEALNTQVGILENKMQASKESLEKNREKKSQLQIEDSRIGNEIDAKERTLQKKMFEESDLQKETAEVALKIKELEEKTGNLDQQMEKIYSEIDRINQQVEEKKEKFHKIDALIKSTRERLNLKQASLDEHEGDTKKGRQREDEIRNKINELELQVKQLNSNFQTEERGLEKLYAREKEVQGLYKTYSQELDKAKEELSMLRTRVSSAQAVSGLSRAVEEVTGNASLKGILGTVADLVSYKDEYAHAIEAAAGNRMFYIVTETAQDATNAVKFLKQEKIGRATFLPLDKIRPPNDAKAAKEARSAKGVIDYAINLVTFSSRISEAMKYVFSDTLVISNIDDAKAIGIGKARMATLDGDLVEASGVITGGSAKKTSTLADAKRLDSIKKTTQELEQNKQAITQELEKLRSDMDTVRDEKINYELELKEHQIMLKEWQNKLKDYESESQQDGKKISSVEKELQGLEKLIAQKTQEATEAENEISALLQKRHEIKEKISSPQSVELNEEIKKLKRSLEVLRENHSKARVEVSTLKAEIESVLLVNRKNLAKGIKEIEQSSTDINKKIGEITQERNKLIGFVKEKEEKARELASSMNDLYEARTELEDKRRGMIEHTGELDREKDRLKEQVSERELSKAKIEIRLTDLKVEWERYKEVEVLDKGIRALKEDLQLLEQKLEGFGNVNLKAIEMYDQYSKELKEMQTKGEKLMTEKDAIMNMIMEIEDKKIHAFIETFNAINENFDKYFKEFYPEQGSYGMLKLESQEKPLESGLLLEAKPAHKHLRTIDAMSGGEKTITAIAFLFAIQAYKPSPFYILDEIDAALDQANSIRVANMLKKFANEMQFIIVTHNKQVTRESDQIIGIHMNKEGSSVVEIDMKSIAGAANAAVVNVEKAAAV